MSRNAWRGAKLKVALVSLLGLAVIGWAGVHMAAGRSGPRMINVGSGEDTAGSVAVSPDGRTLFAASGECCGAANTVTAVNLAAGRAGRRFAVGGPALKLAVTPDGKTLFALIADSTHTGTVTSVNLVTGRTADPLRRLHSPLDMVASPDGKLLYVLAGTGGKSMAVMSVTVASGHAGRKIPVPAGSAELAISPGGGTLYVGAGNVNDRRADKVIAIDTRSGKTRATIPMPRSVWGLAVSPGGSRLYVLASSTHPSCGGGCRLGPCDLVTINTAKWTASRPLAVRPGCFLLAIAPNGKFAYVLNMDQAITPVETGLGLMGPPIRTVSYNLGAMDFAVAPDGRTIYVGGERGVAVIPVPRCQASRHSAGCPDWPPPGALAAQSAGQHG